MILYGLGFIKFNEQDIARDINMREDSSRMSGCSGVCHGGGDADSQDERAGPGGILAQHQDVRRQLLPLGDLWPQRLPGGVPRLLPHRPHEQGHPARIRNGPQG